ncbi:MAG: fimbria/pilus outer membrane usher protein [Beijerinckiaceae bacterium]|nr:fimbria/pilus outer membrane usher protein [Beijerinckiaceae bacterium]
MDTRRRACLTLLLILAPVAARPIDAAEPQNLQLEVMLNGEPARVIGSFLRMEDGRLAATRREIEEIGLRLAEPGAPDTITFLDALPGVAHEYVERTQTVRLSATDAARKPQTFDLSPLAEPGTPSARSWGMVLNYDGLATFGNPSRFAAFTGTSLTLEGRVFSPYGTIEQSAIARSIAGRSPGVLRLDTAWRYSDEQSLVTYRAGDAIGGGLAWTRPIRLGGLQAQRNFALRPDLVTTPLPSLGGTAGVPSTVEVYVNSIRTFSQSVGTGPFSVTNIPVVSGAGNAQLVIRDAAGRETKTDLPFFATANLLAQGRTEWSVEGGLPRLAYGAGDDAYVRTPVGSASFRGGLTDAITGLAHAEAGGGLVNAGLGAAFVTGSIGAATLAAAASSGRSGSGFLGYAAWETKLLQVNVSVSSQRSFSAFDDLASVTARMASRSAPTQDVFGTLAYGGGQGLGYGSNAALFASARLPRAIDRITFSAPLPLDRESSLGASYIHLRDGSGHVSHLLSASYSRSLPRGASFYATLFHDAAARGTSGLFVGFSMPLGPAASVSASVSRSRGGTTFAADAVRTLGQEIGDYGWRLHDGEGGSTYREASAAYRSRYGVVQASVGQDRSHGNGSLGLRGAIAAMDGEVFATNWVDDGFALVRVGAPGVAVFNENRPVGRTDANGVLLVPTLRSYQKNRVSIDPAALPVDLELERVKDFAVPADRAGVSVDFQVRSLADAALVPFMLADGRAAPAGAAGMSSTGETFIIGYDGEAFLRRLSGANSVTIDLPDGSCRAEFAFEAKPGAQVRLPPQICRTARQ